MYFATLKHRNITGRPVVTWLEKYGGTRTRKGILMAKIANCGGADSSHIQIVVIYDQVFGQMNVDQTYLQFSMFEILYK